MRFNKSMPSAALGPSSCQRQELLRYEHSTSWSPATQEATALITAEAVLKFFGGVEHNKSGSWNHCLSVVEQRSETSLRAPDCTGLESPRPGTSPQTYMHRAVLQGVGLLMVFTNGICTNPQTVPAVIMEARPPEGSSER